MVLEKLTHATVWVHDQDEALDFYTKKLGMEVRGMSPLQKWVTTVG